MEQPKSTVRNFFNPQMEIDEQSIIRKNEQPYKFKLLDYVPIMREDTNGHIIQDTDFSTECIKYYYPVNSQ